MKLIIVESPHKAKTIKKYLGKEYDVLASGGHIRDLPQNSLGVNPDNDFEINYEVIEDKKRTIETLKKALKNCNGDVYLATDPDREGEAISWHLKEVLGIPDEKNRIEFNEITKKAVTKALENPRELNYNLVDAQQARRVLDRLVGYKLSPIVSKKIKSGLSAGRVQSVALKMLTDREKEIEDFNSEEYWNIYAFLSKDPELKKLFKASLYSVNGKKFKASDRDMAYKVVALAENAVYSVAEVKKSTSKSFPQPPFTTSTMQQEASSKLGMSATQIMSLAQNLYEGVDIAGEGHVALITYIRTDSVRVATEAQFAARDLILDKFGDKYVPSKFNVYKTSNDAQDAHEAIRPTYIDRTPESLKDKLPKNHYRLYKLVYERFLASQMTPAQYDTLSVDISAANGADSCIFKLKGKALSFDGYQKIYKSTSKSDPEEENIKLLPTFENGESLYKDRIEAEQKFTQPPQRYTVASLIKALEENGIGRPSTYATILNKIKEREYTTEENKYLKPTQLGFAVVDSLEKYFPDIMNIKFTADMEKQLDVVADAGKKWQTVISDFYPKFLQEVKNAYYDKSKPKVAVIESDVICEKCGAKMVVKEGKYDKFLACPNYPACKNTKPFGETVGICPVCGHDIIKKKSQKGKNYYACTNYPACKFISWDPPAPFLCPKCHSTVKMVKTATRIYYKCTSPTCDYKDDKKLPQTKDVETDGEN